MKQPTVEQIITNKQQKIIDIISFYEIDVFSCNELIDEFNTVLHYDHIQKYKVNIPKALKLLKEITTDFTNTYPIKNYIPEDKDDHYIIVLSLQTNSGFVTSGDSHILSRKQHRETRFRKLKIINKTEFEMMFPL